MLKLENQHIGVIPKQSLGTSFILYERIQAAFLLMNWGKFPEYVTNRYSTRKEDMPDEFTKPEMNDERIRSWASTIGPNTLEVIDRIFRGVQIKEQGYNAALSVLNLSKHYPNDRFENACAR